MSNVGHVNGSAISARPRLLMVARMHYELPLSPALTRKFDALRERFTLRVLAAGGAAGPSDDGVFRLVGRGGRLDGLLFYLLLPGHVRRIVREFRPEAVVAQSPYEAALIRLARVRAKLIVEVHGDWRTATRMYGSPLRRALSPVADAIALWGLRHADAVRSISPYTSALVREQGLEPIAEFATYSDLGRFLDSPTVPLPEQPAALFIGVLERYKNVDGLANAWRAAAPRVPDATLRLVGRGTQPEIPTQLLRDVPGQTEWVERLTPEEVATALDAATCLVLPSRSEGLGRVLIEAFLRGRPAIGMAVGGIRDVIEDGVNGLLVSSDAELAEALVRVLSDRELAARLAEGAAASAARWYATPDDFADNLAGVVRRTLSAS
ncbi:MAG: glycosyltransferase family 4 protein [Actinomycetes bacterium]